MAIIYVTRGVYEGYNTILQVGGVWDFEDKLSINKPIEGIHVDLSVDQTSPAVAEHVEFNSIVDNFQTGITISTGSGQAQGIFGNFQVGRTYKLESALKVEFNASNSELEYRWYDRTASQFIGTVGGSRIGGAFAIAGFLLSANQTTDTGFFEFDTIVETPSGTPIITLDSTGVAKVLAGYQFIIECAIAFDAQTGQGISVEWQVEQSANGTTGWTPTGLKGRSASPNTTTNSDDTPVPESIRGIIEPTDQYIRIAYTILGGTFQQIDADVSRMLIQTVGGDTGINDQPTAVAIFTPTETSDVDLRIITSDNVAKIENAESYALVTQQ